MSDDRRPVLVGAAQIIQRDTPPAEAATPLDMIESAARAAAEDAGVGDRLLRELDTVAMVDPVAWWPGNGPRLVAERIGARPRHEIQSAVGGEIPIAMLNELSRRIFDGQVRAALVCGSNNVRTLLRARNARVKLEWPRGGDGEPERIGVSRGGNSPAEAEYGLGRPTEVYPIFENALRARRGLDLETHRRRVGALMSRFSEVAAGNPYAWFPQSRSADEITIPSQTNRMVSFPYTKYMNAVMETDQAAALLLVSEEFARSLGIDESRRVHWWGGGWTREAEWYPSQRPDFARCDALQQAVEGALGQAGIGLDDLDVLDFYSCFPVAVEMACEMLGLAEDDPRGFTVTGGLPYAGGPGNDYTLHSLAATVERLREHPGQKALVTGNGWYLTKHAACVLASAPAERDGWPGERVAEPDTPEGDTTVSTEPVEGRGTIETYTVHFGRDGAPERGVILGKTDSGRRFVANTPQDLDVLENLVASEAIGREGTLRVDDGMNRFDPI